MVPDVDSIRAQLPFDPEYVVRRAARDDLIRTSDPPGPEARSCPPVARCLTRRILWPHSRRRSQGRYRTRSRQSPQDPDAVLSSRRRPHQASDTPRPRSYLSSEQSPRRACRPLQAMPPGAPGRAAFVCTCGHQPERGSAQLRHAPQFTPLTLRVAVALAGITVTTDVMLH